MGNPGAEDARRWHGFRSTPALASPPQPWEGNMPSGRHPDPTKRTLLELEVRICGRWDSWVRVPAPCQSPGRWANISGIKRRAACPARPMGARCCWAPGLHCLYQSSWEQRGREAASDAQGRCLEHLEPDSRLLFWAPQASPEELASESIRF